MKIREFNEPTDTHSNGMAQNQLLKIGQHAIKIENMIGNSAETNPWVAKKIELVSNYIKSVHDHTAGSEAGTYDDEGMSEDGMTSADVDRINKQKYSDKEVRMAKGVAFDKRNKDNMSKATSTIEKVRKGLSQQPDVADALRTANEDAGEQALANDLGLFFVKRAKELLQSMERPNKNDQEYEEFVEIAQAFKKGIQAGLEQVNMSDFEFSNNPFGDFGRGIDDGPDEELVDILNQHGYQPGPDGANDKATIVKQQEESVSDDAGTSPLKETAKMAIELIELLNNGGSIDEATQNILNQAADNLQAVYHYEDYQKQNPYIEEIDSALVQKHSQLVQAGLEGILAHNTKVEDVDTKPGMMRILKKRVNEIEKDIAKENRTDEAPIDQDHDNPIAKPYVDTPEWKALHDMDDKIIDAYIKHKEVKEGGMPSSIIKHKQKLAHMSDEELADRFKGYDEKKLRQMAWSHGYGNMSSHYLDRVRNVITSKRTATTEAELEEGIKDWAKNLAMAGVIVAGLAGVNSVNDAIDRSVPAVQAIETALELAQDQGNDELAKAIEKDLSGVKVRLSSGKDLNFVKDMQEKYSKFVKTEGLAYESKLQVQLNQQLK